MITQQKRGTKKKKLGILIYRTHNIIPKRKNLRHGLQTTHYITRGNLDCGRHPRLTSRCIIDSFLKGGKEGQKGPGPTLLLIFPIEKKKSETWSANYTPAACNWGPTSRENLDCGHPLLTSS